LNHQHARPTTVRTCCATHTEPLRTPSRACVYPSPRHSAPCADTFRIMCRRASHHVPMCFAPCADTLRTMCRAYFFNLSTNIALNHFREKRF
ncbi:MAG: hypothetical protein K2G76_04555, partial [Prevotella sp.]|nr:hypothetical protein [Prevotella sp.]